MKNPIIVPGAPIPCARPRKSGHFMYDPQMQAKENFAFKTQEFKESVSMALESVFLVIRYDMPIPRSFSNRRRLNMIGRPHTGRPDLSNLIKFTEDALNGVLWKDDAIIHGIMARKVYNEEPKTIIWMFEQQNWETLIHGIGGFSGNACRDWKSVPLC